jgi:hypothetical protein
MRVRGNDKGENFMNAYFDLILLNFLSYEVILVEKVIEPAFILHLRNQINP